MNYTIKESKSKLSDIEKNLLFKIYLETNDKNIDNVSRTSAYFDFYLKHPDIIWAFLASMVSRNGGYNMCDLEGEWFPKILESPIRKQLFLTYERANWTIFHDAYPQLLLYHYSTKMGMPMFHLLAHFHVSSFMVKEWKNYWVNRDKQRLMNALIVNEQNVIHHAVIHHHFYEKKVFHSLRFFFQDFFHFSAVLLPTIRGEIYGASVNGFKSVHKRINLGKRIASVLFDPELYPFFLEFALKTEHTGSRYDYEQYIGGKKRDTPFLRMSFPVIVHHNRWQPDWFLQGKFHRKWMNPEVKHKHPVLLTEWFLNKQKQLQTYIALKDLI
ncbi:DUF2515 domain-containing protein [Mesobacillus maritimus]|uniref:DUF2515 family protein n=1 Tax=Mesobacillus maritimus TaxID=1643336 RepID=UPI0020411015|nr:DUF2515 family protein [Mesobacillus maritimus]MCM3586540.1 DUF2515 domain-containing protein [Mesobacillus maritimus]MCM3669428.1 DUF2515 domain-containing protein [Mesobacillus maritimus]